MHLFRRAATVFALGLLVSAPMWGQLEQYKDYREVYRDTVTFEPRSVEVVKDTPLDKQTDSIEYAKYGILVPVGNEEHFNTMDLLTSDEELLCKAMLEVMGNKELRDQYSRAAAERAADFSVKNTKKQWVDLIESLTGDLNGKH